MNDTKLLLDVANNLRSLADSIQALVPAIDGNAPAVEDTEPSQPAIKLETLRAKLGTISRAGYTDQIRNLLQKHGATHLSKVDPRDYETLLKEAEALVHAT